MNNWIERIESLDLTLFNSIRSQTSIGDKTSLLAVQRAIANKHKKYIYLEIGSYLGGSIQPHLVDSRCEKIYSLDPRPSQVPDERGLGYVYYEKNSSERMIELLSGIGHGNLEKIDCIDLDASEVAPEKIELSPQLIFIDGEHTNPSVLSDFEFCNKVVSKDGVILFHDFWTIHPAVLKICSMLDKQDRPHIPLKLEGSVFAIFFDPDIVRSDAYLASLWKKNRYFLPLFSIKMFLNRIIPSPIIKFIKTLRNKKEKT